MHINFRLQRCFFMEREIRIIKTIETLNLVKVQYTDCDTAFWVDLNFISDRPIHENSLSLAVLGGIPK